MNTSSELIRTIDFFQPLDDRLIDRIARLCINREYSPGDYIVRLGDPGLGLYFITRGSARVEIARDGAIMPIAELHAGEFVGELSIIDNKPRSANVVCNTEVSCLLLTRNSFMTVLHKYPEIALQMAKTLAARLRSTDEHLWEKRVAVPEPRIAVVEAPPQSSQPKTDIQRVKDSMTDAVSWVYLLKSVTKFSLAVVGCPVKVTLETKASRSFIREIGPLKIVVVPSDETHMLGIHAFADGAFKATIIRPGMPAARFGARIRRDESVRLPIRACTGSGLSGMRHLEAALDL